MRCLALLGLGLFTFSGCSDEAGSPLEPCDFTLLVEPRGLGEAFVDPILHAISESSRISRRPVSFEILRGGESLVFVFANDAFYPSPLAIEIDKPHLFIGSFHIELDGEKVSNSQFQEAALRYGSAAKSVDARGIWEISTNTTVSMSRFVDYLEVLHESGIQFITY